MDLYYIQRIKKSDPLPSASKEGNTSMSETHLPKVLVVGLLPSQSRFIKEKLGKKLNLRFAVADVNPSSVARSMGDTDAVVALTNFISHRHDVTMKKHGNYIRHTGGVTKLTEMLEKYAEQSLPC